MPLIDSLKKSLNQGLKTLLLGVIGFYKAHISCHLMTACRFNPTCSEYAAEKIKTEPLGKAFVLIGKRLSKCHPFTKHPETIQ